MPLQTHFTAWLTTAWDCLEGDVADVTVLRDEPAGERPDGTIEWTSAADDPLFHDFLGLHYTTDIEELAARAEQVLTDNGWSTADPEWADVPTGLVISVTYDDDTVTD